MSIFRLTVVSNLLYLQVIQGHRFWCQLAIERAYNYATSCKSLIVTLDVSPTVKITRFSTPPLFDAA